MPASPNSAVQDTPVLRSALAAAARRMNDSGLNRGSSGNLSHRVAGGFLVTPSGMPYEHLVPEDIVFVDRGGHATGRRLPSSEWHFHAAIYEARLEANVVLHTHSVFSTTLACLGSGIPAFHYMVARAGGSSIRCAPYATFGTAELARHAVAALEDRTACLLANHGLIVIGPDFDAAQALALEVETLAEMYWRVRQAGEPVLLDEAEMAVVIEKFQTYGKQPQLADETQ